jgi:hypothetical protein
MLSLFKSTFFLLSFSLFLFSTAFAQGIPGVGTPLSIIKSTENPRPGETVSLTAQSYSFDIDSARITWTVDGKTLSSDIGLKRAEVTAGEIGTIKTVTVSVVSPEGTISQSVDIRPADLTLLWESASYVPAFYKGKALFSHGGSYKITAFPHITDRTGKRMDPKALVYKWSKNGATDDSVSGYGKTSYLGLQSGFVQSEDNISVIVSIPSEDFSFTESLTLSPTTPEIHFYEKSPLYGIWLENALPPIINLDREEIAVEAEPYFFSTNSKKTSLEYAWSLNDESVFNFDNKSTLILRKVDDQAGISSIDLSLSSPIYILQGASKSLIIRHE